jgi:threonine/homoserine/homoserine lactone efflux protein
MSFAAWGLFVLTELALSLTPGPVVLFVLSRALRHGGRRSLAASLGILAGNAAYFLLSACGLGAVLLASHALFRAIKRCGAIYLIGLGVRLLAWPGHEAPADGARGDRAGWADVRRRFVLQAANPKALVFFAALLPQFLDSAGDVPLQVGILAASSMAAEFLVLAGYGMAAGRLGRWARGPRFARTTERVAGSLLVGAGAGLGLAPAR